MTFSRKLIGDEEERAVSPVIGVILMVAITVILAAVIAAFVLDLGGSVGEEAQAGVNIESSGNEVTATLTSEGNVETVRVDFEVVDVDPGDPIDIDPQSDVGILSNAGDSATVEFSDNSTLGDDATVEVDVTAVGDTGDTETVVQTSTETIIVEEE